ncbi:hypothetical protein [Clostridium sp.]|uniref:hypothetical protein n=1 Tax=Clostridium sp. TaxID=1506 RepID=UPI00290D6109|nr:hypothetical protein [Clostridium sp.]MDU7147318.1 hypothetical protein [Clostridium sp.]MDU7363378.1 hypothetical protein [Clostridium sp.]
MPSVIHTFSRNQFLTHMLEIILNIITKQQLENDIWVNLDWCINVNEEIEFTEQK